MSSYWWDVALEAGAKTWALGKEGSGIGIWAVLAFACTAAWGWYRRAPGEPVMDLKIITDAIPGILGATVILFLFYFIKTPFDLRASDQATMAAQKSEIEKQKQQL